MVGERVGRHRRKGNGDIPVVAPTPERRRHGPVEHGVETVTYDADGRAARALADHALGTIESMARRGVISDEAVTAAESFRGDFQTAALQALRAAQMRERTGSGLLPQDISFRAERARQRVYEAIQ